MAVTHKYATEVMGPATEEEAVAAFHDHAFFFRVDPNLISFKADTEPRDGKLLELPDEIKAIQTGETRCYEVLDRTPGVALFSALLPGLTTTTIHYQITNTKDGAFMFFQAPLGASEERRWVVEKTGDGLRIVEHVTIFASFLLYGSIKGLQDQYWRTSHTQYVEKMGGQVGAQSAS